MFQTARPTAHRVAFAFAAVALGCALLGFGAPVALAEYNIAAPSKDYTAVDSIAVKGSPIAASRIPAGTYHITASTSSSMASMSDVTLTVRDGSMSVNFTLTPSYTAVYPGKPEEAASLSNDDGTAVSSAYIMGKLNADGETRNYTMPISSLNAVLVYSAYNGNSKRNSGMWYGRNVCFNSSPEIDALVATSSGGGQDADDPGKGDPGTGGSGGSEPAAGDSGKGDSGASEPGSDSDSGSGNGSGKGQGAGKADAAGNDSAGASHAAGAGGKSSAGSVSTAKADKKPAPSADEAAEGPESAKTFSALGGPFAAIAYADESGSGEGASGKQAQALDERSIDYQSLLGALIALLLIAGFAARVLVYRRQRE